MQTFGQIPMFQDGDFELVQSSAIMRYLARKHGEMPFTRVYAASLTFRLLDQCIYRVDLIKRGHAFQPITSEVLLMSSLFLAENKAI